MLGYVSRIYPEEHHVFYMLWIDIEIIVLQNQYYCTQPERALVNIDSALERTVRSRIKHEVKDALLGIRGNPKDVDFFVMQEQI